jgi:hypothetical protein
MQRAVGVGCRLGSKGEWEGAGPRVCLLRTVCVWGMTHPAPYLCESEEWEALHFIDNVQFSNKVLSYTDDFPLDVTQLENTD